MATVTLTKWGNSQGVIIPKTLCDDLGIRLGDKLIIELHENKVTIEAKKEYTLSALMSGYKGSAPEEYDWGEPAGKEMW